MKKIVSKINSKLDVCISEANIYGSEFSFPGASFVMLNTETGEVFSREIELKHEYTLPDLLLWQTDFDWLIFDNGILSVRTQAEYDYLVNYRIEQAFLATFKCFRYKIFADASIMQPDSPFKGIFDLGQLETVARFDRETIYDNDGNPTKFLSFWNEPKPNFMSIVLANPETFELIENPKYVVQNSLYGIIG